MNNPMEMMLQQMISQNPGAYKRAQQMCSGKSPEELRSLVLNIAQSQGRDIGQIRQIASMFGINL